jgi:hypothetical protein
MPSKPAFDPYALRDVLSQLDAQQKRIEKYLNTHPDKPKKKSFFRRLFGWLT